MAFNGNGDSPVNRRLVSLAQEDNGVPGMTSDLSLTSTTLTSRTSLTGLFFSGPAGSACNCDQSDDAASTLLVGLHSGLACILCCLLAILLGYKRR